MHTFLIVLGVILWIALGVLAIGLNWGYFMRKYPWSKNTLWEYPLFILGGPGAFLGTVSFLSGKGPYAFQLRPYSKEQRWQAHKAKWPTLTREYFERTDR